MILAPNSLSVVCSCFVRNRHHEGDNDDCCGRKERKTENAIMSTERKEASCYVRCLSVLVFALYISVSRILYLFHEERERYAIVHRGRQQEEKTERREKESLEERRKNKSCKTSVVSTTSSRIHVCLTGNPALMKEAYFLVPDTDNSNNKSRA